MNLIVWGIVGGVNDQQYTKGENTANSCATRHAAVLSHKQFHIATLIGT